MPVWRDCDRETPLVASLPPCGWQKRHPFRAYLKVCTLNRVIADIWGTLVFELAELLSSCFSPSCRVVYLRACGPSLQ